MTERNRGADWSIWDLHVHSPSSIVQNYGPDDEETWARYIDALEALPKDVRVIGLNDYWFLDGYNRVRNAKLSGRLQNLDAIFPVLEMRIDQFGGTESKLARANLHVIFDPELEPRVIQQQFLDRLHGQFSLTDATEGADWKGAVTRESLMDLGRQMKETVPADELHNFDSDLEEGFNQLNLPLDSVLDVLESSFLKGKALVGLGKTEWNAIKWKQAVASKRNIISNAKFLFTAFEDPSDWAMQVEKLKAQSVNHRLLDCSDAHTWADSTEKDRLGACSTWMNTTPTFAGLIHAIDEFENRVFVGLQPPALDRGRKAPDEYVDSIAIRPSDPTKFRSFNYELPLHSGFVAIVGNKGQGKSALLDCIALAGNSSRNAEFAFLTPNCFLTASNKAAKEYASTITWRTAKERTVSLTAKHDPAAPVLVEYLPRRYVEKVCTTDPLSLESHIFENELRDVLFTHIPEQEKTGETSFEGLIARKTTAAREQVARLRAELRREADAFSDWSDFIAANVPSEIEGRIGLKRLDLETAEEALAADRQVLAEFDAASGNDQTVGALRRESEELAAARQGLLNDIAQNQLTIGSISRQLDDADRLVRQATDLGIAAAILNREARSLLSSDEQAQNEDLVTVRINQDWVERWRALQQARSASASFTNASLQQQRDAAESRLNELANALAAVDSTRELARQRVLQGEERIQVISGSIDQHGSLVFLQALLDRARSAPVKLQECQSRLISVSEEIHKALLSELEAVLDLYAPASRFIADSQVVQKAGLEFRAALEFTSAIQRLSASLDGRRNTDLGSWIGELPQRVSAMSWDDISGELALIVRRLGTDRGAEDGAARHAGAGLRAGTSLPDFLVALLDLSWLEVRFGLIGDGLPLAQLSPGQRGLVLALFYLIVDRRTTPLLLDQPEENLDNATIASVLVPAIREASARRQTIIVTHNANLAVVGDADQIVHASVADGVFNVSSGSISELGVAKSVVDILEGTKPAFDNRRHKYEAFPLLNKAK
ncbi:chromosome segregation protein SMC [Curtobacterium sp. A7_M15]|uniref:TrlF family AAA-like ATPase n=1 Tax=Curtobacterium sp. A7_M15 TaxID=3065241 RepID=UPI002737F629|nr:chromosome segregation protein SMC [Curtobacterium sp. A7_M15]MDP4331949.1 chromosome segregation protein SMC [Curtobacterium sp. A7_M15]